MSTLKTHNLQSPDAGSVNILMTPNAGMVVAGISTFNNRVLIGTNIEGHADADDLTIGSSTNTAGITIRTNTAGTGRLWFSDGTSGDSEYQGYIQYDHNNQRLSLGSGGTTKLHITSEGNVIIAETMAVNRPRIVLSAPNDGTNYRHLFGANLQVNSSGTFTTPTANISGGGWEYLSANSLNDHGDLRYLSAPDTNSTSSTPLERLRIDSAGNMSLGKGSDASTQYTTQLQIYSSDTGGAALHLTNSASGSGNGDGFHLVQQGHIYHWLREDAHQIFATQGLERMRLTSGGQLLIGTTSGSELLMIKRDDATGPTITLENNANKTYINNWGSSGGGSGRTNRFEINATLASQASYCAQYHTFMIGGVGDSNEKVRILQDEFRNSTQFYSNKTEIASNKTITTSYNHMSIGNMTINSGVTVTVNSGARWVIV